MFPCGWRGVVHNWNNLLVLLLLQRRRPTAAGRVSARLPQQAFPSQGQSTVLQESTDSRWHVWLFDSLTRWSDIRWWINLLDSSGVHAIRPASPLHHVADVLGSSAVGCRTHNCESPGSNPVCYRFNCWAFSFSPRRPSSLSYINEYLAIGKVNSSPDSMS